MNSEELSSEDFKIVAVELQSRHSNSTKYKIFVKYIPNVNSVEAILGDLLYYLSLNYL